MKWILYLWLCDVLIVWWGVKSWWSGLRGSVVWWYRVCMCVGIEFVCEYDWWILGDFCIMKCISWYVDCKCIYGCCWVYVFVEFGMGFDDCICVVNCFVVGRWYDVVGVCFYVVCVWYWFWLLFCVVWVCIGVFLICCYWFFWLVIWWYYDSKDCCDMGVWCLGVCCCWFWLCYVIFIFCYVIGWWICIWWRMGWCGVCFFGCSVGV